MLGIPFYVWDLSETFADEVIDDFLDEYRAGRTPNPCLRCNERIKFSAVLERSLALGFDAVATGHYARVVSGPLGTELHRAADPGKDQSYVLGVLSARQVSHSIFPLGEDMKGAVRAEAERRGLLVAHKPDSHDICFIPDGDTAGFLRRRLGVAPGDIVDVESGAVVGTHEGTFGFTIGQRRGLGLGVPTPEGNPRYVVGLDVATRTVMVGPPTLLDVDMIEGLRPIWTGPPLGPDDTLVTAQVRAHGLPIDAVARVEGDRLLVHLREPVRGLAPGQAVVLYDGTRVVGSATVDRTRRTAGSASA